MLATNIPFHEQRFHDIATSGKKIRPINVTHPDGNSFVLYEYLPGHDTYYYKQRFQKKRIILHFTAGFLGGDVSTLTQVNRHVSVPFVVARSGNIYNLHSSRLWSNHLGLINKTWDRSSIGIEISNIGPLQLRGDYLVYVTQHPITKAPMYNPYCHRSETQYYKKQTYRDRDYFATYTDAQYESVARLLTYLTKRDNIPRAFLPESERYEYLPANFGHEGILSHVNYRQAGEKWDIGPSFDWARII